MAAVNFRRSVSPSRPHPGAAPPHWPPGLPAGGRSQSPCWRWEGGCLPGGDTELRGAVTLSPGPPALPPPQVPVPLRPPLPEGAGAASPVCVGRQTLVAEISPQCFLSTGNGMADGRSIRLAEGTATSHGPPWPPLRFLRRD